MGNGFGIKAPKPCRVQMGGVATVEVAETRTAAPGTDASVENIGSRSHAKLVFTIPSVYGGGYYSPVLDEDGNLSWQASQVGMQDIPTVNIMGPQGTSGVWLAASAPEDAAKWPVWVCLSDGGSTGVLKVYDAALGAYSNLVTLKGDDGVSPTVTVEAIDGGKRITITDAGGTKTVDILNGTDGNFDIHALPPQQMLEDGDEMAFYDASAAAPRKITAENARKMLENEFLTAWETVFEKSQINEEEAMQGGWVYAVYSLPDGMSTLLEAGEVYRVTVNGSAYRACVCSVSGTTKYLYDAQMPENAAYSGSIGISVIDTGAGELWFRMESPVDGSMTIEKRLETPVGMVSYAQTQALTQTQQEQARQNIGAQQEELLITVTMLDDPVLDKTFEQMTEAWTAGIRLRAVRDGTQYALSKFDGTNFTFVNIGDSAGKEILTVNASYATIGAKSLLEGETYARRVNGKTGDVVLTGADIGFTDAGGYYTADTAEGALAEIGAQLDGLAAALEGLL